MSPTPEMTPAPTDSGEDMTARAGIDVTILMPCLNERITLPACIDTAEEAVRRLFLIPSAVLVLAALVIAGVVLAAAGGQMGRLGGLPVGDHWLILAGAMLRLGISGLTLVTIARVWASKRGFVGRTERLTRWVEVVRHDRAVLAGAIVATAGFVILGCVAFDFFRGGFGPVGRIRETVVGASLPVGGIHLVFASFVVSLIDDELPSRR